MNRFLVRCLIFVCFVSACDLTLNESKSVQAEGRNIFDKTNRDKPKPTLKKTVNVETVRQMSQSLSRAFAPDAKQSDKEFFYYGIFFAGLTAVIAGLLGWRIWKRKQLDRELNDPMILVQELNYVHQLSSQEKRVMQELSVKNSLQSPLKLFVEPKYFLDALENKTFALSRPVMRSLLSKLFGIELEIGENSAVGTNSETALFLSKIKTSSV